MSLHARAQEQSISIECMRLAMAWSLISIKGPITVHVDISRFREYTRTITKGKVRLIIVYYSRRGKGGRRCSAVQCMCNLCAWYQSTEAFRLVAKNRTHRRREENEAKFKWKRRFALYTSDWRRGNQLHSLSMPMAVGGLLVSLFCLWWPKKTNWMHNFL